MRSARRMSIPATARPRRRSRAAFRATRLSNAACVPAPGRRLSSRCRSPIRRANSMSCRRTQRKSLCSWSRTAAAIWHAPGRRRLHGARLPDADPVASCAMDSMTSSRDDDSSAVRFGADERYAIPDALAQGGYGTADRAPGKRSFLRACNGAGHSRHLAGVAQFSEPRPSQ